MADVINLRQRRKAKARDDKKLAAEQSRISHGLSKQVKQAAKMAKDKSAARLDGKQLDNKDE